MPKIGGFREGNGVNTDEIPKNFPAGEIPAAYPNYSNRPRFGGQPGWSKTPGQRN